MDEYVSKFVHMRRFVPYMIADEIDYMYHLQKGFRLDIQKYMMMFRFKTYAELIDTVHSVE